MIEVVGVRFSKKGRMYYFDKNDIALELGDEVIVETERGLQYGFVIKPSHQVDASKLITPLREIIRVASNKDKSVYEKIKYHNIWITYNKCNSTSNKSICNEFTTKIICTIWGKRSYYNSY